MSGGEGLISYCLIQIYTLLLGCRPKSRRCVFSGPKGKLTILNLQSNIEQLLELLLSDPTATLEHQLQPAPIKEGKQNWF